LAWFKSPLPNHIPAGERRLQPPLLQFSNISALADGQWGFLRLENFKPYSWLK
jgi:hypothetical protein